LHRDGAASEALVPQTILVVEDDSTLLGSLVRYLTRSGFCVLEANSCKQAFAQLDEHPVDLMLADLVLPDGQGYEVIDRALRQAPPPLVIAMTGHATVDNAIAAVKHGVSDFLLKPFSLSTLSTAIERLRMRESRPDPTPLPSQVSTLPAEQWRSRFAPSMIGQHPKLLAVLDLMARTADTDSAVLIGGETGTARSWWRAVCVPAARGARSPSCPWTARRSRKTYWKASYSGTHAARSPEPRTRVWAASLPRSPPVTTPMLPEDGIDLAGAVERFESALILQALERTGGNKNRAATLLRMNRTTLIEKVKKRGVAMPDAPSVPAARPSSPKGGRGRPKGEGSTPAADSS